MGITMKMYEKVYAELLRLRVVTRDEIVNVAKSLGVKGDYRYIYIEYVYRFLKEGRMFRVRRGLYGVVPPEEVGRKKKAVADKYLVSAKVRYGHGYLGYHTALEMLGSAHSMMNVSYVVVDKSIRFSTFEHGGYKIVPVIIPIRDVMLEKMIYKDNEIRVTNPSRTFVDCLDRPDLTGGWEECLKSLAGLKGVDISKVHDYLKLHRNDTLTRKCGYVMELLSEESPYYSHLKIRDINPMRRMIGKTPMYMERGTDSEMAVGWKLYVPKGFERYLRGV